MVEHLIGMGEGLCLIHNNEKSRRKKKNKFLMLISIKKMIKINFFILIN